MSSKELLALLYEKACIVMQRAYQPYSQYRVGAALSTKSGAFFVGCNVENVSYGLTICAEGNAISTMVAAHGAEIIEHILIVASGSTFPSPCGACRQIITEFSTPETEVHLARARDNSTGFDVRTYRVSALLPLSFSQHILSAQTEQTTEKNTPHEPVYEFSAATHVKESERSSD